MNIRMMRGLNQSRFKDDLEELARDKLRELGDFPVYITPALKERIKDLQEEFLELRQTKKFTEEKGIAILKEVDSINKGLASLPQTQEEVEARKRKIVKPKSKRTKGSITGSYKPKRK
jgi:hypothetical protein